MNKNQRFKNRATAENLERKANRAKLDRHVCEECGELGGHWIQGPPMNLYQILGGLPEQGFWTCNKFYGPDGRRINP